MTVPLPDRRTVVICSVVTGLLASGAGLWLWAVRSESARLRADPTDVVQVARGATVYRQHCASCHGARLEGQPDWRTRKPDRKLPAPPHDETGHTWHHADRQLFEITKSGVAALVPGYQSDMPAFGAILADERIWDVLAFIKSEWPAQIRGRQRRIDEASRR